MKILDRKDAINHHKEAINRRLYKKLIIVETAIHRVSKIFDTDKRTFQTSSNSYGGSHLYEVHFSTSPRVCVRKDRVRF